MKQNYFESITYGQYKVLNTIFYNDVDDKLSNISLEYDEEACTKLITAKKVITKQKMNYFYADFEADVSGDIHKPFMRVLQSDDGIINEHFYGEDCAKKLLNFLPSNCVVYFHNLAYDIRFLASYGITKSIIKGTKVMMTDVKYNNKVIHFKDTLPMLSCKLSQLPQMFNIIGIQKEIFPYKYYTLERLKTNVGEIDVAGNEEDKPWNEAEYNLFKANIEKLT